VVLRKKAEGKLRLPNTEEGGEIVSAARKKGSAGFFLLPARGHRRVSCNSAKNEKRPETGGRAYRDELSTNTGVTTLFIENLSGRRGGEEMAIDTFW